MCHSDVILSDVGGTCQLDTDVRQRLAINAGAGDRIIIRHFVISGAGEANTKGIELNTGQLALFNSTLKELSIGLNVSNTKADLVYSDLIANTTAINTSGTGVDTNVFPFAGPTQVRIAWVMPSATRTHLS